LMGGNGVYINTNPDLRRPRAWRLSTNTIQQTPAMSLASCVMGAAASPSSDDASSDLSGHVLHFDDLQISAGAMGRGSLRQIIGDNGSGVTVDDRGTSRGSVAPDSDRSCPGCRHQGRPRRRAVGTQRSNVELVDAAVNAIQKAGSEPATTAEVQAELAAYKMPAGLQSPAARH
jgi:hypothetical protein